VSWTAIKRLWSASNQQEISRADARAGSTDDSSAAIASSEPAANYPDQSTSRATKGLSEPMARSCDDDEHPSERTSLWRRRALTRKGAHLYSKLSSSGDFDSIAMLDEDGIVVAWYERAERRDFGGSRVLHGHVSRLYMPEDVALGVPVRELCSASINGSSTQLGWRRRPDGTKYWARTVIQPILLRDGRTQGFSHVTRRCASPWEKQFVASSWSSTWLGDIKAMARTAFRREGANSPPRSQRSASVRSAYVSLAIPAMVALMAIGVATVASAANPPRNTLPKNAIANAYGSGWECEHGFRRVSDACAAISLPANAYLDASGNRWRCDRGYLSVNEACVAIKVPAHAYLDESYGTGWRCDRGYRETKGACSAVQIPVHAYAVDSSVGSGWECERGYILKSGACEALAVPANGYLTRGGDGWKCERGFTKAANSCVEIRAPANGYLNMEGDGWSCERGFRKTDAACAAIAIPANAHLDYSGGHWRCDRGFRDRADGCVKE
jgi:hypothetical protein